MSAPVENLIQRLSAKSSGNRWVAKCPAHEDKTPSLSITEGSDGRALLKCFAGCEFDAILSALGMRAADLFPAPIPAPDRASAPAKSAAAVTPRPLGELLDAAEAFARRFVTFPLREQSCVIALWILHTWTFRAWEFTPYLNINAASKRAGKSRLLEMLKLLCYKPRLTSGGSAAALIRSVDEVDPMTLLLDEVDCIYNGKNDSEAASTQQFLNAGYEQGSTFLKCVGPGADIKVKEFPAFCPKAFAGIGKCLPDTVLDRSIPIEIMRQSRDEKAEKLRKREAQAILAPIRAELEALRQKPELIEELQASRPQIPEALHDRAQETCEPLIAIADKAGGEWPQRARTALVKLLAQEEDADIGVKLLGAIQSIFDETGEDKLPTEDILKRLIRIEDGPWASMFEDAVQHERIQTAASRLAKKLKLYKKPDGQKIQPRLVKLSDGSVARGYYKNDFTAVWDRLLPLSQKGVTSVTSVTYEGKKVTPAVTVTAHGNQGVTKNTKEGNGSNGSNASTETGRETRQLLTDLLIRLNADARIGLYPKGHPDCPWRKDGYPREYTAALHHLANSKPDEERDFKALSRLVYKIGAEDRKGTPLQSPVREWSRGGFPAEYRAAQAYLADQAKRSPFPDMTDEEWSKYDAEFRAGKWLLTDGSPDILSGHWLHFRDAADFRAFYSEERPLPETCVGLEGSDSRSELEAVQDTLYCGCKLADESDGFYYHPGCNIARCTDCQSAEWIAQGFEVVNGFPHGDWQATIKERLKEQAREAQDRTNGHFDAR